MRVRSRQLGSCLVCGDVAVGINFGVPTCMPCKAFFRRNAVKLGRTDFICQDNGDCPITHDFRRMCNCCRLAKCFRVGMQKSMILSDEEKLARKELVQKNREKRALELMARNPVLIRPSTLCRLKDEQPSSLSPSDQGFLTNISGTYELVYGIKTQLQFQNQDFPTIEHTSVHSFFNEYEDRHKVLIEYFKHIPEFNRIVITDKIRLIRNHFGSMMTIHELLLSRSLHRNLLVSLINIFGMSLAKNTIEGSERLLKYVHDPILIKIVLIIQTLSSGIDKYRNDTDIDRVFDDTLAIFFSQNIYVELLWRYILAKMHSEKEAVKFFNKLILDLLFIQRACFGIERYMCDLDHEVDQMKPLMQSMWPRMEKADDMDYNESTVL